MTLTGAQAGRTMQGMGRRLRALTSAWIVAGMFSSALAACTAEAAMPEMAQMACCKAGHHTCAQDGTPAECCENNSTPQPQWTTVAKTDSLKAPARVFLTLFTPARLLGDRASLVAPLRVGSTSPPTRPLGPPVYIAFSTLLI